MTSLVALLITYNQERYVREAALDVLAQDVDDLKVVFSDDASTDGTFDVLMDIASTYKGDKHVIVRRNHRNLGMNAHVNLLVSQTSEDILVPFAGDDRFENIRVRKLAAAMENDAGWLAHSDFRCIDSSGAPVRADHLDATFRSDISAEMAATSEALFVGAVAAWRRRLFDKYGPLPDSKAYEDLVLGFRAALEQGVVYVPEKLVNYRVGVGRSYLAQREEAEGLSQAARLNGLERSRDLMHARLKDCRVYGLRDSDPIVRAIASTYEARSEEISQLSSKSPDITAQRTLREILAAVDSTKKKLSKSRTERAYSPHSNDDLRVPRKILELLVGVAFRGALGRLMLRRVSAYVRRSKIVDEEWYLREYKDVRDAGHPAVEHYLLHGMLEGRKPRKRSRSN